MEMAYKAVNQCEDNSTDEDCEVNNLRLKKLQEDLSSAKNLKSFFLNADPYAERSRKFKRELQNCLSPYREIYNYLVENLPNDKIERIAQNKQILIGHSDITALHIYRQVKYDWQTLHGTILEFPTWK